MCAGRLYKNTSAQEEGEYGTHNYIDYMYLAYMNMQDTAWQLGDIGSREFCSDNIIAIQSQANSLSFWNFYFLKLEIITLLVIMRHGFNIWVICLACSGCSANCRYLFLFLNNYFGLKELFSISEGLFYTILEIIIIIIKTLKDTSRTQKRFL